MTETTILHLGWLSLLPALVVVVLAIYTKRVIESLVAGIGLAALIIDWNTTGFVHAFIYSIPNTIATVAGHPAGDGLRGMGMTKDSSRGMLLISVILLGSFITVLDKSGGGYAFADRAAKRIKNQTGAMLTSWVIGMSVFTSAYFSILINGTAMKPIFDRLKISREKLAFFCDATAAPTKALIPVSGWVAFMIALIEENIDSVPAGEGFSGFIKTMPYNLYCWAIIGFTILLAFKLIPDFGPMRQAEQRVKKDGRLHKSGTKPMIDPKAEKEALKSARKGDPSDMFAPLILSVILMFILGMWNSFLIKWFPALPKLDLNSLEVMCVAFAGGLFLALVKYTRKRLMKAKEFFDTTIEGGKSAIIGAIIIILAVTLSDTMRAAPPEGLGTASFIIETMEPFLVKAWIPALTFIVSAFMSFATGTSWGVWAIMMPISVPLAVNLGMSPFLVAGAVLSGGAFGDHCSPISDTSVLSSLASNTDHLEHVRTQLPYALATASVVLVLYLLMGIFGV